ncbi:MAG: hypothetical protein AAF741_05350 [Bacteroidota bacterium]
MEVRVELYNRESLQLLKQLEKLKVLKRVEEVETSKTLDERKVEASHSSIEAEVSATDAESSKLEILNKLVGSISKKRGDTMLKEVEKSKDEWDRDFF